MKSKRGILTLSILLWLVVASVLVRADDETNFKGLVTGRTADALSLRTVNGGNLTVLLTDETKVQTQKGWFRHERMAWSSLIPGLRVNVRANSNPEGKLVAREIEFSKSDLQYATMIQAGLAPTQQQVDAHEQALAAHSKNIEASRQALLETGQRIDMNEQQVNQRFSDLADYEVKNQTTIYFASGKATIDPKYKAALAQLASSALKLSGYIIQVQGFADASGKLEFNQTLSRDRAFAVMNYLMQECNVAPRHIVSPGAMGISNPVASNETSQGRAENRRVELKVLVSKGIVAAK